MANSKVFNKLVRDKIIEQIQASGREATFKILNKQEYIEALRLKVTEEFNEFNSAATPKDLKEELADLLEVLYALKHALSEYPGEVSKIQKKKRHEKGSFKKKMFLIEAKSSSELP